MGVFDKELMINGKAVRSPEQQVYQNMKDIEELQEVIKPEYKCTTELSTSATSVAKSYTNAGEDVNSGWLLDPVGKKFKITGGDEDNLLIVFYTSYQGPQGPSGVSAIDDDSVSLEKVWSSQKVFNEVARAKDKGVYITSTEPTLSDGVYTLVGNTDITNRNTDVPIKTNDLVIYIDSNNEPTSIYKVLTNTGSSQNLTLSKIGDYAKGKQLYQHNVKVFYQDAGGTPYGYVFFATIISDSNEEINTQAKMANYLYSKGLTNGDKALMVNGHYAWSSGYDIVALYSADGTNLKAIRAEGTASLTYNDTMVFNADSWHDTVITL